jgi:hypothetical protein
MTKHLNSPEARDAFTSHGLDTFTAVGLAEGFIEPESDEPDAECIAAWQHLVNTGVVWQLQGTFGRQAAAMIEAGILDDPRNR